MATNKHAIIRYQALDKCFRNIGKRYFMNDLIEACNQAIFNFSGRNVGVQKRQIFEDIKFMESDSGYSVDLVRHKDGRKVYYRYSDSNFSINNQPLNESESNQLKEALLTLNRFKGLPQFSWVGEMTTRLESNFSLFPSDKSIIQFEQNEFLNGLEYISTIFHAISYEKVLDITYQGFKQTDPIKYLFHPQLLKQYNNRWFLFGCINDKEDLTNLSLDRIIEIKESTNTPYKSSEVNYAELFEDVIGVSISKNSLPQKIELKLERTFAPYIYNKPIHGSQKVLNKDKHIIQIEVHINYELISLLLSFGEGVEVVSPQSLRMQLKEKISNIASHYE